MTNDKANLFKHIDRIKGQLDIVTKHSKLHDPKVVKLSEELDRLILQFYKK